jgi:hypothetical protein
MPLSANRDVKFYASQEIVDLPVDANVNIYKGAFVGRNASTGLARPLAAGDLFVGLAYKQANNAGGAASAIDARMLQDIDIVHTLTSVAQTNVGADVYASDDSTLTLTASGNSRVGRIVAVEGANLARIRLQPAYSIDG